MERSQFPPVVADGVRGCADTAGRTECLPGLTKRVAVLAVYQLGFGVDSVKRAPGYGGDGAAGGAVDSVIDLDGGQGVAAGCAVASLAQGRFLLGLCGHIDRI